MERRLFDKVFGNGKFDNEEICLDGFHVTDATIRDSQDDYSDYVNEEVKTMQENE